MADRISRSYSTQGIWQLEHGSINPGFYCPVCDTDCAVEADAILISAKGVINYGPLLTCLNDIDHI